MNRFLFKLPSLSASQWLGAGILLCLGLFILLEGLLHQGDSARQNLSNFLATPSAEEWLGTDQFGRSMLARMGDAIRLSLMLSLFCVTTRLYWVRGWAFVPPGLVG
ncbi:hypothetical protein [Nitrincola sp. A-D6]|uniref:hypothetical protein n=1 Tax=Nitrincola sp. A-D6 TaxID=1545442 RepID=UPI000A57A873|nr:hypothetical protein [Nitrincola sp. A-D6]